MSIKNLWAMSSLLALTPMYHGAAYAMQEHAVRESIFTLDEIDVEEQNSLVHAVQHLYLKDVSRLLAAGVNPNIPNSAGRYALHEAVRSVGPESTDMVRLLLQKQADPEIEDVASPIYIALIARNLAFEARVAKVQALIVGGARVDVARVHNILNIKRTPYLAGEYYPGEPADLAQIIKEELDARTVMAEHKAAQAQPLDFSWGLTV